MNTNAYLLDRLPAAAPMPGHAPGRAPAGLATGCPAGIKMVPPALRLVLQRCAQVMGAAHPATPIYLQAKRDFEAVSLKIAREVLGCDGREPDGQARADDGVAATASPASDSLVFGKYFATVAVRETSEVAS